MTIQDILSVGLTAEDFDTMITGIDAILEKEIAQDQMQLMTQSLLETVLGKRQPRADLEQEFARRRDKVIKKFDAKKEDWTILKSKLILLKRLLLSNEAVKMAQDIANTPPIHK